MRHLLEEKLEISSEKLSEQLSLFFLSAVYNLSKTQIFSKQSLVEIDGLASEEEYQRFFIYFLFFYFFIFIYFF